MNNFSKIVILIILVMSFFYIKEKCPVNIEKYLPSISFNNKTEKSEKNELVKEPVEKNDTKKDNEKDAEYAYIYFLALDKNGNGIYKKVKRNLPNNEDKLEFAIKELMKGPNLIEKSTGAYSEIPPNTKLLGIKQTDNKIIIDFSSEFQNGGGTDSIYSRMMQLIKTSINNTDNQKIYLHLDGKQVNFIGGEGIMITQPLSEKSLEG